MCCSCANIYPLLRNRSDRYASSDSGFALPVYYVNAFSHPEYPVVTNFKPHEVQFFLWGLIPSWCRSLQQAQSIRVKAVNARCETVFSKPTFAESALYRRCLVPVTGFYEWHSHNGKKYPFYITLPGVKDFALAGIWNQWTDPATGEVFHTFCILTTKANPFVAAIHNEKKRMPVILSPEDESRWLDNDATVNQLKDLFQPYRGPMKAWPVRKISRLRSVPNNVPAIQNPWFYPELEHIPETTTAT
ncbi:MAG: SOS response-associated peptidase [Planctomycetia bacterium]|nr:SOS response-associated peptidase [Planctomycetia bacterium]